MSLAVVVFVLLLWELYQRRKWSIIIGTLLLFGVVKIGLIVYLGKPINQKSAFQENYVSLKQEWNKRAKIPYDSLDLRKQGLKFTLERYLISKNLPVRGDGVAKLLASDIQNIEKGYADINETKSGLMARLYGLRFQIHHSQNPSGHSLLERLEYWKTALEIIKENPIIGVGTGDVNDQFLSKYDELKSPLTEERRLRAHNSYLTETITFGILGLVFFISWLLYFLYQQFKFQQLFGVVFMLVAIATFLIEDTLETQMGVTFFALFYAVFSRGIENGELKM
jgi:O-antigen ligase